MHLLHRIKRLSNISPSVSQLMAGIEPRTHRLAARSTTTELTSPPNFSSNRAQVLMCLAAQVMMSLSALLEWIIRWLSRSEFATSSGTTSNWKFFMSSNKRVLLSFIMVWCWIPLRKHWCTWKQTGQYYSEWKFDFNEVLCSWEFWSKFEPIPLF